MSISRNLTLLAALSLLVSCSGNGLDCNDQGPINPNPTLVANQVTSIEGLLARNNQGHVLVGDAVLYTNNSTKIVVDGVQTSKDELQPGMIVLAEGKQINENRFECTSITTNSIVSGNIEAMDVSKKVIRVAGKTVIADEHSYFAKSNGKGNGYGQSNFAKLSAGNPIMVCGYLKEGEDAVLATRICSLPVNTQIAPSVTAQGTMSSLNTNAKTFFCGGYTINYGGADVTGMPQNGCRVIAAGTVADGVMYATRCYYYDDNGNYGYGSGCRSIYGRMAAYDPENNQFQLYGGCCGTICYWVYYDEYTPIVGLNLSNSQGANIRVEGTISQNGKNYIVKATKISK